MAGFDLSFTYDQQDQILVQEFVNAARRRARVVGLRWHSSQAGDQRRYYLAVNGHSSRMAALAQRLARDLPIIAEAIQLEHRNLKHRRRLAYGFVQIYSQFGFGSEEVYVPHLEPIPSIRFQWVPHLLYLPSSTEISSRLLVTESFCVEWYFGTMPAPTMLEELHTAAELVLNEILGRSGRDAFRYLVDAAGERGLLDGMVGIDSFQGTTPKERSSSLLLALKDARREVRHRAAGDAESWLRTHFWDVIYVIETLCETRSGGLTGGGTVRE